MPARRKYFGSFIEYTALVGALGYQNTVELFRGSDLLCIDEFELDDPGDTMVMTRLLAELVASGTRLAATSNTPPNALGEGRFAAQDFLREIHAMAASFQTIRIDGTDYRHRALDGHADVLERAAVRGRDRGCRDDAASSSDDALRRARRAPRARAPVPLHPPDRRARRWSASATSTQLDRPVGRAAVRRLHRPRVRRPAADPGDRASRSTCVFPEEMLAGGYRKKYLRAISRLVASTLA